MFPLSAAGANLQWKNAQKKELKNIISETINKSIPKRSPISTTLEWRPCVEASLATSAHHWIAIKFKDKKDKKINKKLW